MKKREITIMMIGACLLNGFDMRRRIIGALSKPNMKERSVAYFLDEATGDSPDLHCWSCDWQGDIGSTIWRRPWPNPSDVRATC